MLKKFPAFLVLAGIFCALFVVSSFAETQTYEGGYVPSPIDMSHLKNNPPVVRRDGRNVGDTTLPSTYDLRNVNGTSYLPSVRDQGSYGTCWAFAALGAVESNYLMQSGTYLAGSEPNLSEAHLAWFVYKDPADGHAFGMRSSGSFSGGEVFGQGGNSDKAIAFMSRFAGPTLETQLPYTSISSDVDAMTTVLGTKTHPEDYPLSVRLHDAYTLGSMTETLRDTVKQLIIDNGAVEISYCSTQTVSTTSSTGAGDSTSPYYRKDSSSPYSYYKSGTDSSNHAVLIVGWDDDFSTDNFNPDLTKPTNNGAWLVRNSWGSTWGDSGYFWMSYEQNITDVTAYIGEAVTDGMTAYYHDALGKTGTFGYGATNEVYTGWAANVFQAEGNETLSQVSVVTTDNNAGCAVYVLKLGTDTPDASSLTDDKLAAKKDGITIPYAGYHVITLDDAVTLSKGEYFAVVVKMTTTSGQNIAVEMSSNYSDGGTYAAPVVNAGESYFSGATDFPTSWTDGKTFVFTGDTEATPMNACIKAFTVTTESETDSIAVDSTNFPDYNFRSYLKSAFGSYISQEEITATTSLDLSGLGITDLTGITYFTGITELDISGNESVTVFDMSPFTSLTLENITCDPTLTIINGEDSNPPLFDGHSLLLSGQIGVVFYLTLPDGFTDDGAYMTFTVNDTASENFYLSKAEQDTRYTEKPYMFTCPINSIQMAEKITATFYYGDGQSLTVSNKFSASDYIDTVRDDESLSANEELLNIVNAIKDYGHYVQIPLADANSWTIGTDYAEMEAATEYDDDTVAEVKTAVTSDYKIDKGDYETAGLEYVSFTLELNSSTKIVLYLSPSSTATNFPDEMRVQIDGGSAYVPDKDNGVFVVEIDGIRAQNLDKSHTVHVHALQEFDITVSPFSYIYETLNSDSEVNKGMKNAVTSLYWYCIRTQEYRAANGYDD